MKKIYVIVVFLLMTTSSILSQVKLRPGVRLGMNISSISGIDNTSSKIGLEGGAFLNIHFSDFYELQLETLLTQQGAKLDGDFNNGLGSSSDDIFDENVNPNSINDIDLTYASIGVINKFFIIKDAGLHFLAGGNFNIAINNEDYNFIDVDLAFTAGIGYQFPFGLTIDARYKQGIIDLDDGFTSFGGGSDDDLFEDSKNYLNSSIQLGVSYKFDFNTK